MTKYFQRYCVSFKQALAVITVLRSIELILNAAMHSFKFTVFAGQEL